MHAGEPDRRGYHISGGRQPRLQVRPFHSWSVGSLESELHRTAVWLKARLMSFKETWDVPSIHVELPSDFSELRTLARVLDREAHRLEHMADELRLRRHWAAKGRRRTSADEHWRIDRIGDLMSRVRDEK